ncbi:MAG: Ig-like domain-containing protein, partial [Chitinophagaceae bacterium]
MNCRVENIVALPSLRIKRNRLTFIRACHIFFAILFVFALGFNVQGQTATTTTLLSNTNNSCLNDAITLTATVDQIAAAGNVQFSEGATVLGTASLDGNGT